MPVPRKDCHIQSVQNEKKHKIYRNPNINDNNEAYFNRRQYRSNRQYRKNKHNNGAKQETKNKNKKGISKLSALFSKKNKIKVEN